MESFISLADFLDRWRLWHRMSIPELAAAAHISIGQCRHALGRDDITSAHLRSVISVAHVLGVDIQSIGFRQADLSNPMNNGEPAAPPPHDEPLPEGPLPGDDNV